MNSGGGGGSVKDPEASKRHPYQGSTAYFSDSKENNLNAIEQPLVGWKQISFVFNESIDSTKRKYKESLKSGDRMPIFKSGRMKAYRSQLQDWLSRQRPFYK